MFNEIVRFFLPRYCIHCDSNQNSELFLCKKCENKLDKISTEQLIIIYNEKFSNQNFIDSLISGYNFITDNPIQSAIHSLKYQGNFNSAKFLITSIINDYSFLLNSASPDLIIPVPLHYKKLKKRGYNQSAILCKELTKQLSIKTEEKLLIRKKHTLSQTLFNLEERQKNVADAFQFRENCKIDGKTILLVDDVITTGSTILECAKILKQKKAKKIIAFSVALANN